MEVSTVNSTTNTSVQLIADDNLQSIQQQKPKAVINAKSINNNSTPPVPNSLSSSNTNSNLSPTKNNLASLSMNTVSSNIIINNNNNNNTNNININLLNDVPQDQINLELYDDQIEQHVKNNNFVTSDSEVKELISQLVIKIQSELYQLQQQQQNVDSETKSNTKFDDELAAPVTIINKPLVEEQQNNSSNSNELKQSSPTSILDEEATCDLVIDSELPPSNEAQDASSNHEENHQSAHFSSVSLEEKTTLDEQHLNYQATTNTDNKIEPNEHDNKIVESKNDNLEAPVKVEAKNTEIKQEEFKLKDSTIVTEAKELQKEAGIPISSTDEESKTKGPENETDDAREDKSKDMVTLRNLEITPPPPPPGADEVVTDVKSPDASESNETKTSTRKNRKRSRTVTPDSASDLNESNESAGRSKRQRRQTQLFQVGDYPMVVSPTVSVSSSAKSRSSKTTTSRTSNPSREHKKATTSSSVNTTEKDHVPVPQPPHTVIQHSNIPQDVIFYEKNDYLAIRNEEDSFYLCQLTENVKVNRPFIRVRWLDTKDNKSYFLTSLYDQVPQLSILMPVTLNKIKSDSKGDQLFTLGDQDRDNILERLKRSLNAVSTLNSSQQSNSDG